MPVNFAKAIPTDLAATVVDRLKGLHQQIVIPIHREDVVVGIVDPLKWTRSRAKARRPVYQPVTGGQVLQVIKNIWSQADQPPQITIADSGLSVEVLNSKLVLEPTVGDHTRIGVAITSSETGGPMPQARGYTLRLICTNGATAPTTLGLLRFSTDWRVNFDRRLEAFEGGLRTFQVNFDSLRRTYERVAVEPVTDQLFYSLYRQARYIYRHGRGGERLADRALGVQPEQRRQIVAQVRRRQSGMRIPGASIEGPKHTDLCAWDVFNSITATAREELYRRRVALERLGGDLLSAYSPRAAN